MKGKEEKIKPLLNSEGDQSFGCDINMDRLIATKKRNTSFVDERKKQIELYDSYYPVGLSDEGILDWTVSEINKIDVFRDNLEALNVSTRAKIESDRQAKLAATLAGLSEVEKEQLKTMLG